MFATARLILLSLCAALALGGCGLRFAYTQLDWLVPWYLRDYVTLDAGQRSALDERLAARLDWHCRTHLADYAATLRAAQGLLAQPRIDAAELAPYLERAEDWWREVLGELGPDARVLLAGLQPDQIEELAQAFARREREAREEFLGGSADAQHADRVKRMESRLQRWFGRMTPAQRERIAAWSRALQPTTEAWLANRARWHADLLVALQVRGDAPAFGARLDELLVPQESRWTAEHRAAVAHNRALTLELLADLFNIASDAQRQRLVGEVGALAGQFEGLACREPARLSALDGR
ncbi:MAG: DUF6279 family lipoprotein [Thauera sp.]